MKNKCMQFLMILSIVLSFMFVMTGCSAEISSPIKNENGEIMLQHSYSYYSNKDYQEAINQLQNEGFKNFRVNFLGDVIIGLFATDGGIESIQVNDDAYFSEGTYVPEKSVVFLDVHSKNSSTTIINQPVDGQLPAMFASSSLRDVNWKTARDSLETAGFTNFNFTAMQDCSSIYSLNYEQVALVKLDETSSFNAYTFFDVDESIDISFHTISGEYCPKTGLEHQKIELSAVSPTCTVTGLTKGSKCANCGVVFEEQKEIPATGHDVVVDVEAKEATCISNGCTEGLHCATCGEILSVSEELPINPDNHKNIRITEGKKATCISTGISEGVYCQDCETTIKEQEELPMDSTNHVNITVIEGKEATCISDGISDGIYCEDCQSVVKEQEKLPINPDNHVNVVIDKGYAATETRDGLTSGKHCEDCGKILEEQTTIKWYPSLNWLCSHQATTSQVATFASIYKNQTITFNGWIYYSYLYGNTSTIFTYLIAGGDYEGTASHNTIFKYEQISQANRAIKEILGKGRGTNVSASGKVVGSSGSYVLLELGEIKLR